MKYFIVFIFLFSSKFLIAQSFQIGGLEDQTLRIMQLDGKLSHEYSFSSRPYYNSDSLSYSNILQWLKRLDKPLQNSHIKSINKVSFTWMPLILKTQFNSHHPFGWNDGAMIQAKGMQSIISAGFFAKIGPLSIQLQPEFIFAGNPKFETSTLYGAPTNGPYKKIFPGQSSIRLNLRNTSFGISTENLWWGPGTNSSLLMTNNAPGFAHFTFNTKKPIKTPVGSFEWQLIFGKLESDTNAIRELFNLTSPPLTYPQSQDWVYLNGITLTWQPKWTKGLFLGVNRVFQVYHQDLNLPPNNLFNDYLPVFSTLFKKKIIDTEDQKNRNQLLSIFLRFINSSNKSEFYIEYGWNDHSYNLRDFLLSPSHSAAYIIGFKKLFDLRGKSSINKILIESEVTQLQQSTDNLVRDAGNWYTHGKVTTGYTHMNQILGSGIGFGNNSQMVSVKYINKFNQFGVLFERVQNNPLNSSIIWNDFVFGLNAQIQKKGFFFFIKPQIIYSNNYAWINAEKKVNIRLGLGLEYKLNY